jgi:hypothetical protein
MPRFSVLEHAHEGTHWDWLFEPPEGGPLWTFALDALPTPGQPLPARKLPDHRPLYLDYEGPISRNRGTVRRLDSGSYSLLERSPRALILNLEGHNFRGRLAFTCSPDADADADPDAWIARFDPASP